MSGCLSRCLPLVLAALLLLPGSARAQSAPPAPAAGGQPHEGHSAGEPPAVQSDPGSLPPFIPPLTDADRAAAFPAVDGHPAHDQAVHAFVLFDRFELQASRDRTEAVIDARGWLGRDRDRLWFEAEANAAGDGVDEAHAYVFYGRQFSPWWDIVGGIRQDFRPGDPQTWAAVGVQGLAPYLFEVATTFALGASGRTHARLEVEYELLLTNRLILQPRLEAELFGKPDPERGVGAGLSRTDAGFRIRYEIRRELAPYVGITWSARWGETADLARRSGEEPRDARLVGGIRLWF